KGALAQFSELAVEAEAARDPIWRLINLTFQSIALAHQGRTDLARAAAETSIEVAAELGGVFEGAAYASLLVATMAVGDVAALRDVAEAVWQRVSDQPLSAGGHAARMGEAAIARGDLIAARRWADQAVTMTSHTKYYA